MVDHMLGQMIRNRFARVLEVRAMPEGIVFRSELADGFLDVNLVTTCLT